MYYNEINPGIFLSDNGKVHYKLPKCPCCGGTDMISHHKYTDKCVNCGKLYNLYTVRRSARRNGKLHGKALVAHMDVINTLLDKRSQGHIVPSSIDEEATVTSGMIDGERMLAAEEQKSKAYTEDECSYCGGTVIVSCTDKAPYRCMECTKKYLQYKALYATINILDMAECEQLAKLIKYYIRMHNKGYNTPQYSRAIDKLNARVVALGGTRYKFYLRGNI